MIKTEKRQAILEAILLAAGDPVAVERLAKFFKIKPEEIEEEINQLEKKYQKDQSGLALVRKSGWVQLVSAGEYGEAVADFLRKEINEKISPSAAEVLAIVAYRGPISRAEIDYIRGVNCGFLLRNLALRGLVEKKDNPLDNRSFIYEVSLDFLKSLGLNRLEELPDYAMLKKRSEEIFSEKFQQQDDEKNKSTS